MTDSPNLDTTGPLPEPVVSRAAIFHQIRMTVYRLALTTPAPETATTGRALITRPPLLTELRDAIRPDQGGTGSGGSSPSGRLGFDAGAYDLHAAITREIASAYESATDRPAQGATAEQMILEWFIELEATGRIHGGLSDAQLITQRDRATSWQHRIEDHFHPPRTGDIPAAECIGCGKKTAEITIDGVLAIAPAIFWTHTPARGLTVHCRACDGRWAGADLDRIDRLRWGIRRRARLNDLTTTLTDDDWHHIRLDLAEHPTTTTSLWALAARPHSKGRR